MNKLMVAAAKSSRQNSTESKKAKWDRVIGPSRRSLDDQSYFSAISQHNGDRSVQTVSNVGSRSTEIGCLVERSESV